MVKHIILWNIDDKYSYEEKKTIKRKIKENLEGLKEKISGIADIRVNTSPLPSANADLMLDSTFQSEEALKNYSVNPFHIEVADKFVRPFTVKRSCFDFEM